MPSLYDSDTGSGHSSAYCESLTQDESLVGASLPLRLDRILEHPDRRDRGADDVAGLEERAGGRADARGGAGGDDVARLEGDEPGEERDRPRRPGRPSRRWSPPA